MSAPEPANPVRGARALLQTDPRTAIRQSLTLCGDFRTTEFAKLTWVANLSELHVDQDCLRLVLLDVGAEDAFSAARGWRGPSGVGSRKAVDAIRLEKDSDGRVVVSSMFDFAGDVRLKGLY